MPALSRIAKAATKAARQPIGLITCLIAALTLSAGLMITGCTPRDNEAAAPLAIVAKTVDDHSYARPQEARVSHVDLDLTADFNQKILKGTATLTLVTEANAKQVILDTRALDIQSVTDASGSPLKFTLGKGNDMMGKPLTIELPQGGAEDRRPLCHHEGRHRPAMALARTDRRQEAALRFQPG